MIADAFFLTPWRTASARSARHLQVNVSAFKHATTMIVRKCPMLKAQVALTWYGVRLTARSKNWIPCEAQQSALAASYMLDCKHVPLTNALR